MLNGLMSAEGLAEGRTGKLQDIHGVSHCHLPPGRVSFGKNRRDRWINLFEGLPEYV